MEEDYEKMKRDASKFAEFLINSEIDFEQELGDCSNSLGEYFTIKARDGEKIVFFFRDNGYTGVYVDEKEKDNE